MSDTLKTYFKEALHNALSYFKWYRKKIGGTWYHYTEIDLGGLFTSSLWTQTYHEERRFPHFYAQQVILEDIEDYS